MTAVRPHSLTFTYSFNHYPQGMSLAKQMVNECKQEFAQLCTDISSLTARVIALDQAHRTKAYALNSLQDTEQQHTNQLFALQEHMEDIENRNRKE